MSQTQKPLPVPSRTVVDVDNVQGDVILGLPKKKEEFVFFVIEKNKEFQAALPRLKITTTGDVQRARKQIKEAKDKDPKAIIPLALLNIAFSQKGLDALGIKDNLGDFAFSQGQLADAKELGDDGVTTDKGFQPHWEHAFTGRIDGLLIAAGESWGSIDNTVKAALDVFGPSARVVYRLKGSVRPGDQKGHEHFGWEDGISNPAVKSVVNNPLPGQRVIPPGTILLGKDQDPVTTRPTWATEGSFLVFRQLSQLVPEFHNFLEKNPIVLPGLDRKQGSELLGARLVGRWKSGAPIQLSPLHDDPELAKDPKRNNNFVFPQDQGDAGQTACPYAAHIRKTNPRNDLDFTGTDPVAGLSISRAGIPYGPEVTKEEDRDNFTEHERGLAFVCYQSALQTAPNSAFTTDKGFKFIQQFWSNNPTFPPNKNVTAGLDPITGQANGASRQSLGTTSGFKLTLPRDFVVSRGGEYFFSPSIKALKTVFAGVAA